MSVTFIILFIFTTLALIGAATEIYRLRQRERLVIEISHELDALLLSAQDEVGNNKKLIERVAGLVNEHAKNLYSSEDSEDTIYGDLSSPAMLASIIATIVSKTGIIRLSSTDFANVPEEEYVSVYIDTRTQELVLSLDHELDIHEAVGSALFSLALKDDIFH